MRISIRHFLTNQLQLEQRIGIEFRGTSSGVSPDMSSNVCSVLDQRLVQTSNTTLSNHSNYIIRCDEFDEVECFLIGRGQIRILSSDSAPSKPLVEKSEDNSAHRCSHVHRKITGILSSLALETQSSLFQLIHDVLTLKGLSSTLDIGADLALDAVAKESLIEDLRKNRNHDECRDLTNDEALGNDETRLTMSRSVSLTIGDMIVERDCLSGKIRAKQRDVIAAKDGSLLIAESMVIRNTRHQQGLRQFQKSCSGSGFSLPDSIRIGIVCINAVCQLLDAHLSSGENQKAKDRRNDTERETSRESQIETVAVSNDRTRSQIETKKDQIERLLWPSVLCDNLFLLCIRLLSLSDLTSRLATLKLIRRTIVNSPMTSKSKVELTNIFSIPLVTFE